MIASRVTNQYEDSDAFISFTGRKGSGKTTGSLAFCEDLAVKISELRGRGESPKKFFDVTHVKSITETGALELLSGGELKNENSVFLLDDTGTQWSARNWNSPINKTLNAILQICRIYKCVIVANFILQTHIDIQARGMADFRAQMLYKDTKNNQAFFKFYYLEQGEKKGKPTEYKKFLTWHGKRVTKWVIGRPSPGLEKAVKKIRRDNTDDYIEAARDKVNEVLMKEAEKRQDTLAGKGGKKAYSNAGEPMTVPELQQKIREIRDNPDLPKREKSINAIARKLKTTRYWVEQAGEY
jgi:hypothetical protein